MGCVRRAPKGVGTAVFCMATSCWTPRARQRQHPDELFLRERRAFRRPLNFDQASRAGHDEIRVGVGGRVLGIVEVDHRFAADNAAGDGGDMILERTLAQDRALRHPVQAVAQRHPGAGDRGGAGAAVRLQHVAIDGDLPLAEARQIHDRPQRSADQALNLLAAAGNLAGRRLALGSGQRRARQHRVFGRHPSASLTAQPRRRLVLERGRAQHMRFAETDETRTFRVTRHAALEADGAHFVGGAFGRTHGRTSLMLSIRSSGRRFEWQIRPRNRASLLRRVALTIGARNSRVPARIEGPPTNPWLPPKTQRSIRPNRFRASS